MRQKVYLVIGVPGSGKSWVCNQLKDKFVYKNHDARLGHANQPELYINDILEAAEGATKPILIEAPFSISAIKDPIEEAGYEVEPIVIADDDYVISMQYKLDPTRQGNDIPKGHLTRMGTYIQRAKTLGWFHGNSSQVLEHLKKIAE